MKLFRGSHGLTAGQLEEVRRAYLQIRDQLSFLQVNPPSFDQLRDGFVKDIEHAFKAYQNSLKPAKSGFIDQEIIVAQHFFECFGVSRMVYEENPVAYFENTKTKIVALTPVCRQVIKSRKKAKVSAIVSDGQNAAGKEILKQILGWFLKKHIQTIGVAITAIALAVAGYVNHTFIGKQKPVSGPPHPQPTPTLRLGLKKFGSPFNTGRGDGHHDLVIKPLSPEFGPFSLTLTTPKSATPTTLISTTRQEIHIAPNSVPARISDVIFGQDGRKLKTKLPIEYRYVPSELKGHLSLNLKEGCVVLSKGDYITYPGEKSSKNECDYLRCRLESDSRFTFFLSSGYGLTLDIPSRRIIPYYYRHLALRKVNSSKLDKLPLSKEIVLFICDEGPTIVIGMLTPDKPELIGRYAKISFPAQRKLLARSDGGKFVIYGVALATVPTSLYKNSQWLDKMAN